MEEINTTKNYTVFNFELMTFDDQSPVVSRMLRNDLKSINFRYPSKKFFWNKKTIIVDLNYYMNYNFNVIKKEKKNLIGEFFKITAISNDNSKISLYILEIKEVLSVELNPPLLDYAETGRMCYSLKIKCKEI